MRPKMLLSAFMALLVSLGFVSAALAHAELEKSEPAAGATLTTAPTEVRLFFNSEIVEGTTVQVLDASGKQVDNQDGKLDLEDLDHKTFVLTLPALPDGVYTVEYTAASDDGHSEGSSFSFTIKTSTAAAPTPRATTQPTARPAATATPAPAGAAPGAPSTLPNTGGTGTDNILLFGTLGMLVLAGGIALQRTLRRRQE